MWKFDRNGSVCEEFRAIRPKLFVNCAFPQNFHTRKLGEILILYAVKTAFGAMQVCTEAYSEPCKSPKMVFFLRE